MKYIYLFGGLDTEKNEFTDTIERYNQKLQIWSILKVKMPVKMTNMFTFSFSEDHILMMGGISKREVINTP